MEKHELRSGFTTGTCAAVAAKAAAAMLLTGSELEHMELMTPKGRFADLSLFHVALNREKAVCAVKKDAGDDPDVTDQALVFASVEYFNGKEDEPVKRCYCWNGEEADGVSPLFLAAGEGIGLVTRPGLSCPVGMPAINPVPRSMIFHGVEEARRKAGFEGSLKICIWMPEGRNLAEKTFNPKLGIKGGLSVLGTTGIVNPMSEAALTATIRLELHMKAVAGIRRVILTPGNYGEAFIKEALGLFMEEGVTCSNFIGDALEMAGEEGFGQILLTGHIGKLIKVAGGVSNTHSKYGDRRMEILWDCTAASLEGKSFKRSSIGMELKNKILLANTMEEAAGILKDYGILEPVMEEAVNRIQKFASLWAGGIKVEVVTFSTVYGILGMSREAQALIGLFAGMTGDTDKQEDKVWLEPCMGSE
ncbi:cobalt-precorrin-5B (C(1))-methyltransferase CbiD [Clostridium sp. Marseille-P2415]|uniref:cobalt-precorrin-5B (C(1))-methyltransferase CbiD n=1 Tax=Clostridium sp. Marseille-P2415 TaxID=1805471 RepID=UPI000988400E|nr:cobalt-precorrin-5B (C(1))-methyltransferase CbiD [Clostridium sp. Marseille-P2415]